MKYIYRVLRVILFILLLLSIIVLVSLGIDSHSTSYLDSNEHPNLQSKSFLIENINVIPMSKDTVLRNKTIFIRDGIIEDISDSIDREGVKIIKGDNNYISPGLIDMHMHLWDKQELGLYLANGITTVRNLWGMPMHLRIKKELEKGEIIGPMFFVSSPKLTGKDDIGDDKVQVGTSTEIKQLIVEYKDRGYDFIKTYAGLPEELLKAALDQAKLSNIDIVSHPSFKIPYKNQFDGQIATLEHAEDIVQQALEYKLDSTKLDTVIQWYVVSKKSFTPTLTGYYKIFEMLDEGEISLKSELFQYMNPLIQKVDSKEQYNRWSNEKENNDWITEAIYNQHKFHLYILRKMNMEGVNIVCGTDAGIGITAPGYSIHQELKLYKEAGLSNYEVLKTATINPSQTHKEFEEMGTVEIGKTSNFVVTKDNPLENLETLREPLWVMVGGKKIEKETLTNFEKQAYDRNNMFVTALRYLEYLVVEK